MKEDFVQYLWRFQGYFDGAELKTTCQQNIIIHQVGYMHHDAGPDFKASSITIGDIEWHGDVEVHLKASDWYRHRHHLDPAYDKVILHVVWKNDREISRTDGSKVPCLEISRYVHNETLLRFRHLFAKQHEEMPCKAELPYVEEVVKQDMISTQLAERLQTKAADLLRDLKAANQDWEQVAYQLILQHFGFKVNGEAMRLLAKYLPLKILLKHSHSLFQMEALLFGMAGLLHGGFTDGYPQKLQKEFQFLQAKYFANTPTIDGSLWKKSRTRPANFPHIRLAQVAAFFHYNNRCFQQLLHAESYRELSVMFAFKVGDYWRSHVQFDKPSQRNWSAMGKNSVQNLLINTVPTIKTAYGIFHKQWEQERGAIDFLSGMPREQNHVLRILQANGMQFKNAADSQGGLAVYKSFCQQHRCLQCKIGVKLLHPETALHEPIPDYGPLTEVS